MAQYDVLIVQNVASTGDEYTERFVNITKGDLLTADSSSVPLVHSAGSNGYLLSMNTGATSGLEWVNPSSVVSAYETSHADVVVDGNFATNGILRRISAGVYGAVTNSSAITNVVTTISDSDAYLPTAGAVVDYCSGFGEGDVSWGTATNQYIVFGSDPGEIQSFSDYYLAGDELFIGGSSGISLHANGLTFRDGAAPGVIAPAIITDASGITVYVTAGDSSSTTSTHDGGNLYIEGGDQTGTGGGDGGHVYIRGGTSVSGGEGYIFFGQDNGVYITPSNIFIDRDFNITTNNKIIFSTDGMVMTNNRTDTGASGDLLLYTGNASDGASGDVYIYTGTYTTTSGEIYLGTGSAGALQGKSSETNVVYYNTTTGKLSYGAISISNNVTYSGSLTSGNIPVFIETSGEIEDSGYSISDLGDVSWGTATNKYLVFGSSGGDIQSNGDYLQIDTTSGIELQIGQADAPTGIKINSFGAPAYIHLQTSSSNDYYIYADSTNYRVLYGSEYLIRAVPNGAVYLYYDNVVKFETKSNGVNIRGGYTGLYDDVNTDRRLSFVTDATVAKIYYYDESEATYYDVKIGSITSNEGIFWDDSANKVGINNDAPSYTLDVNGTFCTNSNVYFTGISSNTGEYYLKWTELTGTVTYSTSDIRLKENVRPWEFDSLSFLNNLNLNLFDWKDGRGKDVIGWIAQDVEELMPEMVGYNNDGIRLIKEPYFLNHFHQAIKQQSTIIEQQQKEINILHNEIDLLREQIGIIINKFN